MRDRVIVCRHQGGLEFIATSLSTDGVEGFVRADCIDFHVRQDVDRSFGEAGELVDSIPVIRGDATPEDVRKKTLYGNVPYHLGNHADSVWAIEFGKTPPRGQEYTLADMLASEAKLVEYVVLTAEQLDRIQCGATRP